MRRWDATSRVIILSLALVFVLVLVLDVTTYWSARRVHVSNDRVKHTYQVMNELDETLLAMKASEFAVRTYLTTRAPQDRRAIAAGYARYELHVAAARRLTVENSAQQENLARVDERYRRWVEGRDKLISAPGGADEYTAYLTESTAALQWFENHVRRMERTEEELLEEHLIRQEAAEQVSTRVVIWGTGLIAALILGLGIWTVRRVQTSQRQIHQLAAEKELLLKEVQHRVKNAMNTMVSMLSLQAGSTKKPGVAAALSDAAGRFGCMAALYDQLYRHGSGSVRDYLARVVDGLVRLLPGETAVHRMCDIEDYLMDAKRLSTLGLIINELVTNAIKYAFPGRVSGQLAVTLARRDGTVVLTVEDDGPGMPDTYDPANPSGFGITMVKALVGQLEGSFRFEERAPAYAPDSIPGSSTPGTRAVVEFPV